MPELTKIQCTCGAVFQIVPTLPGPEDEAGNRLCENCAVEQGLQEGLSSEPDVVVVVVPEGGDAVQSDSIQEEAEALVEAIKVDGRTKAGREAKRAAEAS